MKKVRYILAALVLALSATAPPAHAAVTAFLSAGAGCNGGNSTNFTPGGPSVQVSMCVSSTVERLCGTSYRFIPADITENGRFNIMARTLAPAYSFSNVPILSLPVPISTPPTGDLGSLTETNLPVAAAANQLIATYDIAPQATATNNSYQISLDPTLSSAVVDQDNSCGGGLPVLSVQMAASFFFVRNGATGAAPAITSANTSTFALGAQSSFVITVTGSPPPTLSVTGTLPAGVTFNPAAGILSGMPTTGGTYPLTIVASNGTSVTQAFTLVVSQAAPKTNQTISFAGPPAQILNSTPITLTATATSGMAVVFSSSSPSVCSVSGATLTMITVGTCTITVNQAGSATVNPAPQITHSFAIAAAPAAAGAATLSASVSPLPPVLPGANIMLTMLVKMLGPAGTVTVSDNGATVTGCAQLPLAILSGAADSAVATCTMANVAQSGVPSKRYVVTYAYPSGHASGRTSEQVNVDVAFAIPASATPGSGTPFLAGTADYTDMWWAGEAENGWGMSITQHGFVQFNVIFAYDSAGRPVWYVMPGGSWNTTTNAFTGSLYQPTSSPFNTYNTAQFAPGAPVGSATITYSGSNSATLAFTINGISGTKSVQRQVFASNTGQARVVVNDLWWAGPQEDGWGINIAQQGSVLFPVWYTYDATGRTTFFTVPGGTWSGTSFTGDIYTTTSSAWLGVTYNPAKFAATKVGTMTLGFGDQNHATLTYTVNGTTQTKSIVRQPF